MHNMPPIATDVARSVVCVACMSVSVGHTGKLCKTAELIEMPFGVDCYGSKEPCIIGGPLIYG